MPYLAAVFLLAINTSVLADGFRCGTRLVLTGDPVSRLSAACGQPDDRYRAYIEVHENGRPRSLSVTQWVYPRRGKKPMIVSVRDSRVVRIERG